MLRLLAIHDQEEQVFALPETECHLGSASENAIVLRVRGVSRRHALVRRCPGGVELVDLGSKNGLLVEGRRVDCAILTPGLRLQIGAAWLELQELPSAEAEFALRLADTITRPATTRSSTAPVEVRFEEHSSSPEAALRLAYHMERTGVGAPGERGEFLVRLRVTLGAATLALLRRKRGGGITIEENDGEPFTEEEAGLLASLAGESPAWPRTEVRLKSTGALLLAGRGDQFFVGKFREESLAREGWRRDFLRFLGERVLVPARDLKVVTLEEINRVLTLTGGNKSETARLLGIKRQTIYNRLK
jgi:hypothetical protein